MLDEVIAAWLVDPMRTHGWPPNGPAWTGALRDQSVEYWANLEWEKREFLPNFEELTPESRDIISQTVDGYFHGQHNEVRGFMGQQGKQKLLDILRHVDESCRLPSALVMLDMSGLYEVVDGAHRLAVHFHTLWTNGESLVTSPADIWVGIDSFRNSP